MGRRSRRRNAAARSRAEWTVSVLGLDYPVLIGQRHHRADRIGQIVLIYPRAIALLPGAIL